MVSIGGCDYCGEYCAQLSVNSVENFELPSGWIPPSAIDRHRSLVASRLDCSIQDGDEYVTAHAGALHGRNGERLDTCPNCSNSTQMDLGYWDTTLDHSRCLPCWAGPDLARILTRRDRGAVLDAKACPIPIEDPLLPSRCTEPADRARVANAFRTYLGTEPPIRWVDSPEALGRSLEAAAAATGQAFDLTSDPDRPPWALQALVHGYEDGAGADDSAARIVQAIAAAAAPLDLRPMLELLVDAGQFSAWPAQVTADDRSAVDADVAGLAQLLQELRLASGPIVIFPGEIVACERPLALRLDALSRPHSEDGPAIAYPDGFVVHAWHGVRLPDWIVTNPEIITPDIIDAEPNLEVRRVMIERFGIERLIREGGAELVHQDETGRLWRRPVGPPATSRRERPDEPIAMVEVLNATPEPDGSRKTYFLRVPPTTLTARDAVAWTFGMEGQSYRPDRET